MDATQWIVGTVRGQALRAQIVRRRTSTEAAMESERLTRAIDELASLFTWGAIRADTDPAGFLAAVATEIKRLRASRYSAGDARHDPAQLRSALDAIHAAVGEAPESDDASLAEVVRRLARSSAGEGADPGKDAEWAVCEECSQPVQLAYAHVVCCECADADLQPWYESDGSVTMLPVEEVVRRRKAEAKVIEAARAVCEIERYIAACEADPDAEVTVSR
jgi:hypothetical protein